MKSRLGARIARLLWRIYFGIGERVTSSPLWRWGIGRQDLGRLLDGLVRRILPAPSTREVELTLFNDCTMVFPPRYQDFQLYEGGTYQPATERGTTRVILERIRQGMCVVDVGAHLGFYTHLASKLVGPSGRVYAFEPDPHHFPYLLRNIRRNGCDNVVAERLAISDRSGQSVFFSQPGSAGSSLYDSGGGRTDATIVDTITLDGYLAREGWPSVDLVKMDIEGGEKAALEGMVQLSQRNAKLKLIFEVELRSMRASNVTAEELLIFVRRLGFQKFYAVGEVLEPIQVPDDIPVLLSKARQYLSVNVLCEKE